MSTVPLPSTRPVPAPEPTHAPKPPADEGQAGQKLSSKWLKYLTPIMVLLLATAILVSMTRNWNAWEGGHVEQVTDALMSAVILRRSAQRLRESYKP